MNIQGFSFNQGAASSSQLSSGFGASRKVDEENSKEKSETLTISFAKNQQKYITRLQEQITKIRNDENLDGETKKAKIAELEKQILEAEKAMQVEAAKKKEEEEKKKKVDTSENLYESENKDGDTFKLSKQSHLLLQASTNLTNIHNAYGTKKTLDAERNRLESELNTDLERGLSGGGYKTDQIAKLSDAITDATQAFTDALESGRDTAKELTETDSSENDNNDVEEKENEDKNKDNAQNFAE